MGALVVTIEDWLDQDSLDIITGWVRDGYTLDDIAEKMGINTGTLRKWRGRNEHLASALKKGMEMVNYQVENALLKAALGYRTKEVSVRTVMQRGKVIETITTTTTKEFAPNVGACQTWLYNKAPATWKKDRSNEFDPGDRGEGLQVIIRRAKRTDDQDDINTEVELQVDGEDEWGDE